MSTDPLRRLPRGAADLARHAAVPVAIDARFLNLLRVNFFLDPPAPLPYETEADLLLSPVFREIGDGLYEIDPALRGSLLGELSARFGRERLGRVAALLEQYTDRSVAWRALPELENAQRLTALNLLDPARADAWLQQRKAESARGAAVLGHSWFVAMESRLRQQQSALQPADTPDSPGVTVAILTTSTAEAVMITRVLVEPARLPVSGALLCQVGVVPSGSHPDGRHRVVLANIRGREVSGPAVVDELIREFPELRLVIVTGTLRTSRKSPGYEVVVGRRVLVASGTAPEVTGIDEALLTAASSKDLFNSIIRPLTVGNEPISLRVATFAGPGVTPAGSDADGLVFDTTGPRIAAAAAARGLSWFIVKGTPVKTTATEVVADYLRLLLTSTGSVGRQLVAPSTEATAEPGSTDTLFFRVSVDGTQRHLCKIECSVREGPALRHVPELSTTVSRRDVPTFIARNTDQYAVAFGSAEPLRVEVFLPAELLNLPIPSAAPNGVPLGAAHVVVVHSLDRMRAAGETQHHWHARWAAIESSPRPRAITWPNLEGRIHADLTVDRVVLTAPPSTEAGAREFQASLRAGVPAIFWNRDPTGDPAADEIITQLSGEPLGTLPERLQLLRAANAADPTRYASIRNVALVWDDPAIVLPAIDGSGR
ncbi:hypothetical protein [Actinoplanes sp. NPDC049802]|uniref:VMAP-C domain-containing protein n=1 Tax=Actinoplanes sp. NPDC049802 TaxID=3154742 RepID=UPI0033EC6C16